MDNQSCCSQSCCCGEENNNQIRVVSTDLTMKDKWGSFKVRWGIGRGNYRVEPGLYAVGNPCDTSPVLVSANYKLTFDTLRKELKGLDCWILILDTKGVNVWCSAGKGTFGTDELICRMEATQLSKVVSHGKLILPQLSAVGVNAFEVKRRSGFSVSFGPIRAKDIKAYLENDWVASEEMRRVTFDFWERVVLTPIELLKYLKYSLMVLGVAFLVGLFAARPFGIWDAGLYLGTVFTGSVLVPALLPLIPGRAFAWKGWLLGAIWTLCGLHLSGWLNYEHILLVLGYLLALPAVSAYIAMNFTGSSTYTSFSGVMKEMKIAVPLIVISLGCGVVLLLIKTFIG